MRKKSLKQRLKEKFFKEPKNIWFNVAITVILVRYVFNPLVIVYLSFFQVGLIAPDLEAQGMHQIFGNVARQEVDSIINPLERMYNDGSTIAKENPRLARFISYGVGAFMWSIQMMYFGLILNLIRLGIIKIIAKVKKRQET